MTAGTVLGVVAIAIAIGYAGLMIGIGVAIARGLLRSEEDD